VQRPLHRYNDQYFVQMDCGEKVWFWPAQLRVDDN